MIDLGDYPLMQVVGEPVKPELAVEIIRRIDVAFQMYGPMSDDKVWKHEFHRRLKMPPPPSEFDDQETYAFYRWRKKWGVIPLQFIYTDWVASNDPTGWIRPDGSVSGITTVTNKRPTSDDLLHEWRLIAEAFPLTLSVSFYTESKKVMQIAVKEGKSDIVEIQPDVTPWSLTHHCPPAWVDSWEKLAK